MTSPLTVVTWNVQGRAGLDVEAAAEALAGFGPDVVALQEVQRGQARALSARLGPHWHGVWGFKHWPVVTRPEGVAVLSRFEVAASRVHVLRPGVPLRSTRRVAVVADLVVDRSTADPASGHRHDHGVAHGHGPGGGGRSVRVASVHLSPAAADGAWRERELTRVAATDPDLVLGDLNAADLHGLGPVVERHGWSDCWDPAAGAGCTHWSGGREADPDHRLDFVLAAAHLSPLSAVVPAGDEAAVLAALSDHLPVVAQLSL